METWLWKGILGAVVALPALSGAAWAQSNDNDGCTDATLQGDYAFSVEDWSGTPLTPSFVVGIKNFDGMGKLKQIDYPADGFSSLGNTFRMGETGTYTVNPDCTGHAEIDLNVPVTSGSMGVIKVVFVISGGGRHVHEVVSEFTPPGATGPVPNQTRADDWKIGSE